MIRYNATNKDQTVISKSDMNSQLLLLPGDTVDDELYNVPQDYNIFAAYKKSKNLNYVVGVMIISDTEFSFESFVNYMRLVDKMLLYIDFDWRCKDAGLLLQKIRYDYVREINHGNLLIINMHEARCNGMALDVFEQAAEYVKQNHEGAWLLHCDPFAVLYTDTLNTIKKLLDERENDYINQSFKVYQSYRYLTIKNVGWRTSSYFACRIFDNTTFKYGNILFRPVLKIQHNFYVPYQVQQIDMTINNYRYSRPFHTMFNRLDAYNKNSQKYYDFRPGYLIEKYNLFLNNEWKANIVPISTNLGATFERAFHFERFDVPHALRLFSRYGEQRVDNAGLTLFLFLQANQDVYEILVKTSFMITSGYVKKIIVFDESDENRYEQYKEELVFISNQFEYFNSTNIEDLYFYFRSMQTGIIYMSGKFASQVDLDIEIGEIFREKVVFDQNFVILNYSMFLLTSYNEIPLNNVNKYIEYLKGLCNFHDSRSTKKSN